MISHEVVEDFFSRTRDLHQLGDAQFDIDQVCRWSFFFVDASRVQLEPLADHLQSIGYEIWGYLEPSINDTDPVYFLRADRVEMHTAESLLARNSELYAVAAQFGVRDYDGMDVGAVAGP